MKMKKKKQNSKTAASELGNGGREKRQSSLRNPLKVKDLNVSSCSSSVSVEAPSGCLRFFLSHHHSSSASKNACISQKCFVGKTPKSKSAPNGENLRGKLSDENVGPRKENNMQNLEKPTSRMVHGLRRKPIPSAESRFENKLSSGFELELCDNAANVAPVTKLGSGCCLDSSVRQDKAIKLGEKGKKFSDTNSPNRVQASELPEIQGGSTSLVAATPSTCYGAGHVLSGVTDKRKCRPRGLLTTGGSLSFESSKAEVLENGDENATSNVNCYRASLVSSPAKASILRLSSPSDEKKGRGQVNDDESGLRFSHCEKQILFESIVCSSSPSSSLGFSSEMFNNSNNTITTSDATTASPIGRKGCSFMNPDPTSEINGFYGSSFNYMVCSPSSLPSPTSTPSCKNEYEYDHVGETTPCSEDSVGSGNVIRTPQSDSISPHFGLFHLSRDEISRLWFEYELESVVDILRRVSLSPEQQEPIVDSPRTSFGFTPLIKPARSTDFTLFQKAIDNQTPPRSPKLMSHSFPESEVRISWREGLAKRISEMDELACCWCFSDDEIDTDPYSYAFESHSSSKSNPFDSKEIGAKTYDCSVLVQDGDRLNRKGEESFYEKGPYHYVESISQDRGRLHETEESGWKVCYRNHLFQA